MAFDLSTAKPSGGFDLSTAVASDDGGVAVETVNAQPGKITIGQMLDRNPNIATMQNLVSQHTGTPAERALRRSLDDEIQETVRLHQLRETNPYLADEIEGMSKAERSLVGIGRGMTDIARGAGIAGDERATGELDVLEEFTTPGARTAGQMAPFAPLGAAVSTVSKGLPALAAYSGLGAAEGYTSASGEGVDPTLRTAIGAVAPGAAIGTSKILGRGASYLAESAAKKKRVVDTLRTAAPNSVIDDIENVLISNPKDASKQIAELVDSAVEAGVNHPTVKRLADDIAKTGDASQASKIIKDDRRKAIAAEAAQYRMDGSRLKKSPKAKELINSGVDAGDVQIFAGSSPATKVKLKEILSRARASRVDAKARQDIHPQAVVGDSLLKRLQKVQDVNSAAGKRIDRIAENELKNKSIDLNEPLANFKKKLDKMGITFNDGALDYGRSALRGMPEQQKQIDNVIEQLSPQGQPGATAYDAHILKQWFDNQINWGKSSSGGGGIPPKVERAIKGLRSDVNKEIGLVSGSYKDANRTYSETIDGINELKALAGKNRDLGGDYADETLGMLAKRVTSNAMSRGSVKEAMDKIDTLANKYGGKFKDDLGSQVAAVNALERKLGSFSDTSARAQFQPVEALGRAVDASTSPLRAGVEALQSIAGKKSSMDEGKFIDALDAVLSGK